MTDLDVAWKRFPHVQIVGWSVTLSPRRDAAFS